MSTLPSDLPLTNTEHGMLVAFGEFLRQHGLLDRLRQVPIAQKTHDFSPSDKLIEFLAGIMSGIEYLQDLNDGPHPLVPDVTVAQAWGLKGFAHSTGVGRTLKACEAQTVTAVEEAIMAFSRPFVDTTVAELLRRDQGLIYDFDLTGQPVSSTSTTYPDARFGSLRVNDEVCLGYQLARASLMSRTGERIWLAGFHHPGDTVSSTCVQELLHAAERQTGVRPRRRSELVAHRIASQQTGVERTHRLADQQQTILAHLQATHRKLIGQLYHAEQVRQGPISSAKQARLEKQVAGWQKRLPRLAEQIVRAQQVCSDHEARLAEQNVELTALCAWQAHLEADNQANPNPLAQITLRMDAGFASGENLTWLIEMGYWPDTKAPNGRTTTALRQQLPRGAQWEKVGDNAEMVLVGEQQLHACPYPLMVAVERFKVNCTFKYATLVRYGPAPRLPAWFAHYNARQTIEAGNKELKGTFFIQHLMSRSPAGIRLQVLFAGLAANVVRWCRPWLKACAAAPTSRVIRTLSSPKHLVRVAANSAAFVERHSSGTTIVFSPRTALRGAAFRLGGVPAIQLPLDYYRPCKIPSETTIRALNAH